jgi:hypothetical protein
VLHHQVDSNLLAASKVLLLIKCFGQVHGDFLVLTLLLKTHLVEVDSKLEIAFVHQDVS